MKELTTNQINLLKNHLLSNDFYNELNDHLIDKINDIDLFDLLEEQTNMIVYGARYSQYPLVTKVKCYFGWTNNQLNPIDQVLLGQAHESEYIFSDLSEMEFGCMEEVYSDIGKLCCVGRGGGYWGFMPKDLNFVVRDSEGKINYADSWEVRFDTTAAIEYLVNDLEYYLKHKLSLIPFEFVINDDGVEEYVDSVYASDIDLRLGDVFEQFIKINPLLIARLNEFDESCKKIVQYWEDSENVIQEVIERQCCLDDLFEIELGVSIELDKLTFRGGEYRVIISGLNDFIVSYDKVLNTIQIPEIDGLQSFRLYKDLSEYILSEIKSK